MYQMKLSPVISADKIQERVREMGAQLTDQFKGKDVIAVAVLKGSFMFFSDLIREIKTDIDCDFLAVSSYQSSKSTGEVKMTLDLNLPIAGRNVLLIEDIVDTGLTMDYLERVIQTRSPKSITKVALLHKPDAVKIDCKLDMVGFDIPNNFIVGYGLDYQGHYRNLPYIAQLENMN